MMKSKLFKHLTLPEMYNLDVGDGNKIYLEVSGKKENLSIDIAPANFNYAIDIWDLYWLEINDEAGHFNSESPFYNYLPKLSSYYHEAWYNDYVELFPDKEELIKSLFN